MLSRSDAEGVFWSLLRSTDAAPGELVSPVVDAEAVRAVVAPLAAEEHLVVDRITTNERRVDVELRSGGREWWLVYFVNRARQVETVVVHERPPMFDGVPGGLAVIINGPSGAGKSSLMGAVVDADPRPWVMFDEPWLGTVRQPYLIWRDVAPGLHEGFLRGIAALASTGNLVILSAGGVSFAAVREAFEDVPLLVVGLDCPLDILLERERGREGRRAGLAESSLDAHDGWTYDLAVSTAVTSPSELAQRVLAALPQRSA